MQDPQIPAESRHVRRLWGSVGVSLLGTQVTMLALPLTALTVLHASPAQVAALAAAGTAPFLLLGLPAGAIVDRCRPRRLMVVADLARAALLISVPLAFAAGALTLAHLFVVAAGIGALSVPFDVASLSVLPALVRPAHIAAANVKLESTRAVAETGGPALGGALVQAVTAPIALIVDAASYLLSALLLRGLPALPAAAPTGTREPLLAQIRAGIRFCLTHRYIRPLAIAAGWMNFWTQALMAAFITYAVRQLHLPASAVGVVLGVANLGYLGGSLLVPWLNRRIGLGPTIALGALLHGAYLLAAAAPHARPLPWLIAGFMLAAAGQGIWNVDAVSLRQTTTPGPMLARMNATNRFLIWGTMPLGAAAGGLLASATDLHTTVTVAAVAIPFATVAVLLSAVRRLRTMPASPTTAPAPNENAPDEDLALTPAT
ncbi:MFS transporter [Planosporangium flavigriseum]|uniref:MFS transporter n=1 Tax=Planosporangium flavigriseum TaxID=373681 RepID=A0A8J3M0B1_9ACTN|nr:MFS transporter [Planosporangium flavigriseum]NJC66886.1 MFS transporter [Planosporangium flavigriseum]GIG74370.1 MFS transporter [Planosporangium flavigriseum]